LLVCVTALFLFGGIGCSGSGASTEATGAAGRPGARVPQKGQMPTKPKEKENVTDK
jgi:hypothetical protein